MTFRGLIPRTLWAVFGGDRLALANLVKRGPHLRADRLTTRCGDGCHTAGGTVMNQTHSMALGPDPSAPAVRARQGGSPKWNRLSLRQHQRESTRSPSQYAQHRQRPTSGLSLGDMAGLPPGSRLSGVRSHLNWWVALPSTTSTNAPLSGLPPAPAAHRDVRL